MCPPPHMTNPSSDEVDDFGFPIDLPSLYEDKYPVKPRRCGCCRQRGHDRSSCPAIFSAEKPCLISTGFGGGEFDEEKRLNCLCKNCIEYRKYNYPTPEKAAWRLRKLEEELKRKDQEKKRKYPFTMVNNKTDDNIYIYEFNENGTMELVDWTESGKSYEFQLSRSVDRDKVANVIVTSRDFGEGDIHLEQINPRHIIDTITVEYGMSFEYDIKDNKPTYVKILEKERKQWINVGLKLKYLLEQLDRLGASSNPNLECIMDMVQDVEIPEHDEFDKDDAGIPSHLTNTVGVTDIDPPSDSESDDDVYPPEGDIPGGIVPMVQESRLGLRLADFIELRNSRRNLWYTGAPTLAQTQSDTLNHYNR